LNPDLAGQRTVGDAQDGGTLRNAFQLDNVHQALALHAAEAGLGLAPQQRLDALQKHLDFLVGGRLMPKEVHAQGIGAGAELFVHFCS
jgi:hypothetical protein